MKNLCSIPAAAEQTGPKLSLLEKGRALVGAFKPAYWQALIVVAALYFARFDASFVSLRAKQVGGSVVCCLRACKLPSQLQYLLLQCPAIFDSGTACAPVGCDAAFVRLILLNVWCRVTDIAPELLDHLSLARLTIALHT